MEKRYYEQYAKLEEHWWFVGRRRILEALLAAELSSSGRGERRVLDFGCGTGGMLETLRKFGDVHGVDPEPAAIEHCRGRGETQVEVLTGARLPYDDDTFDVVTALDVLEHLDDDQTLLREVRRVLTRAGTAIFTVPAYTWMWGRQDVISHHRRRYTRLRLLTSLRLAGLEPVRGSYFNAVLFPPIAAIRLARRVRPVGEEVESDFVLSKPGLMNSLLAKAFASEARFVARHDLPFGVSILAVAHAGVETRLHPAPTGTETQ